MHEIGFMQGRLSPIVDGKIQSFPWNNWQNELKLASDHGFRFIEWTLDQERLYENPLLTADGQRQILALCSKLNMQVSSLTGDCFMQSPFWKAEGAPQAKLEEDFLAVVNACIVVGVKYVVVPLVDNGSLETDEQKAKLIAFLKKHEAHFRANGICIVFESDFEAAQLAHFIEQLSEDIFGINYDTGNSAALGFDHVAELEAYGSRVMNVHIKDRVLGGTTVPLGAGNADFDAVFRALRTSGYSGQFILQTARSTTSDHIGPLVAYRDMVFSLITRFLSYKSS